MTGSEIIQHVKALQLPEGEYVVFGSCPMALAGIRESSDIDMLVSPELYAQLVSQGWRKHHKAPGDEPLVYGDFEAHDSWDFSGYQPTLDHLLLTATIVDGVPFAALGEVRKWKESSGRPKDLVDVAALDSFMTSD